MVDSHLWETAIHEAGHAVVGYRGSLYSHTLTIEPDEEKGTLGACRSEDAWGGGGNAHVTRMMSF